MILNKVNTAIVSEMKKLYQDAATNELEFNKSRLNRNTVNTA